MKRYGIKSEALVQSLRWPVKETEAQNILDTIHRFKATLRSTLVSNRKSEKGLHSCLKFLIKTEADHRVRALRLEIQMLSLWLIILR
jgi:hypothetical protein